MKKLYLENFDFEYFVVKLENTDIKNFVDSILVLSSSTFSAAQMTKNIFWALMEKLVERADYKLVIEFLMQHVPGMKENLENVTKEIRYCINKRPELQQFINNNRYNNVFYEE